MLDVQQRKVRFMLVCEFLCHIKNAKVCPTCIMELYDVFTQRNVIRGVRGRKNRQKSFGASLVAQMVKCLPAMQETRFDPWVGKIPWRRKWQPTPVFLPGKSHVCSKLPSKHLSLPPSHLPSSLPSFLSQILVSYLL